MNLSIPPDVAARWLMGIVGGVFAVVVFFAAIAGSQPRKITAGVIFCILTGALLGSAIPLREWATSFVKSFDASAPTNPTKISLKDITKEAGPPVKLVFSNAQTPKGTAWAVRLQAGNGWQDPRDASKRVMDAFPDATGRVALPADAGNKVTLYWVTVADNKATGEEIKDVDVTTIP